ncbi:SpoIIE family protein phosphatase [Vallicoccus soli]|uniref:GAF domain-containing protein n=1 Tax=Vallicoccus soli TaxID=2339232 RepID=A0A3A3YWC6_9ACTN|nr:SpoIIE family protein phosphatase [Vallicoccus soli]RJK94219.1 GAF domain-containing protein [Vallicoccus soli]
MDTPATATRRAPGTAAERLAVVLRVARRLAAVHDEAEAARTLVAAVRDLLAARTGFAYLDRGDRLEIVAEEGGEPGAAQRWGALPLDVDLPVTRAVRERAVLHLPDLATRDALFPHLAGTPLAAAGWVVLPLLVDGAEGAERCLGALAVGWTDPHPLDEDERGFLEALASHGAQALDRARLWAAERAARRSAERTAERLRLQQRLSARLTEAHDVGAVTATALAHVRDALGAAGASLLQVDQRRGELVRLGAAGVPTLPGADGAALPLAAPSPQSDAVRRRAPVVLADAAERAARYPLHAGGVAGEGLVCVPLVLEGRARGALSVVLAGPCTWGEDELRHLEAVAAQCAQALERARLFEHTRWVASTLQRSLLPARLPALPGLQVAVRYRPVSRRAEVGGDFYDVFRIAPGRFGLVIGDVSGKGVPAATLTAMARYTVRAAARRETGPAEVLGVLNEAILEAGEEDDRFATVAYLDVEPVEGGARVRLCVGGHPLPVLRRAGGGVGPVGRPGMALGLLPVPDVDDVEIVLGAGDALALFTDGVVEARDASGAFDDDLPERVLRGVPAGADAEEVADRLERAALDFQSGAPRDDIAVLVLRVPSATDAVWARGSAALTLDGDPTSPALARRMVRAFLRAHGLDAVDEVATLLTSEVVTNAVVHARTAVGLRVHAAADRVRVEVSDGSRRRPVRRELDTEATGGRGLLLLDRLATTWDVRRTGDGKTVWFELEAPPADG